MTLEEAIRHYEESEKINKELAENCVSAMAKNHNLENAEKCRQMIEWLTELAERRKQPEIIRCKDCKHYGRKDKRRFYRGYDCLEGRIATIVPDRDFCSRAEKENR